MTLLKEEERKKEDVNRKRTTELEIFSPPRGARPQEKLNDPGSAGI